MGGVHCPSGGGGLFPLALQIFVAAVAIASRTRRRGGRSSRPVIKGYRLWFKRRQPTVKVRMDMSSQRLTSHHGDGDGHSCRRNRLSQGIECHLELHRPSLSLLLLFLLTGLGPSLLSFGAALLWSGRDNWTRGLFGSIYR